MTQISSDKSVDVRVNKKTSIPEGLWLRCPGCDKTLFRKAMEANLHVCPDCGHHFRISATERIRQLCDPKSFEPRKWKLEGADPLGFIDLMPYPARLEREQRKTGQPEAVQAGRAFI
jgi:acetyl-CoA carboxylase carboxyl transferase subunit beta